MYTSELTQATNATYLLTIHLEAFVVWMDGPYSSSSCLLIHSSWEVYSEAR